MRPTGQSTAAAAAPEPAHPPPEPTHPPTTEAPRGSAPTPAGAGKVTDAALVAALEELCANRLAETVRQCQDLLARAKSAHEETLVAAQRSTTNLASCQSHAMSAQASAQNAARAAGMAANSAETADKAAGVSQVAATAAPTNLSGR